MYFCNFEGGDFLNYTTNTACEAGTELPLLELVIGLFVLSMLCFVGFLNFIKKEYHIYGLSLINKLDLNS